MKTLYWLSCPNSEVAVIALMNYGMHVCSLVAQSLSHVRLLATPWAVTCQAPLCMGLYQQEYWSELPFPPPGCSLPKNLALKMSLALKVDSLLLSLQERLGFIFFIYKNRMRGLIAEFLMSFCSTTL